MIRNHSPLDRMLSTPRPLGLKLGISILILLVPFGAAALDGGLDDILRQGSWRVFMLPAVFIIYVWSISPVISRMSAETIRAARSLETMDEASFAELVTEASRTNPLYEWIAFGIGWYWAFLEPSQRTLVKTCSGVKLYWYVGLGLMYGFLAWAIYSSFASTRLNAAIHRQELMQQRFAQKPELMSVIERELLKSGLPAEKPLEKPEAPRKPIGYDEAETVTNPESKSFKYRLERESYLEQLAEYQEKMIEKQQAEVQRRTEEVENRYKARETEVDLRGKLAAKGITGESAERFIENFSKPGRLSFDDLVKFHFVKEGKRIPGVEGTQPRRDEFEPVPLLKAGGVFTDDEGRNIDHAKAFSSDLARGSRSGLKKLFD